MLKAKSKVNQNKNAKTQYITIPATIASDSQYPFTAGQEIQIEINPNESTIIITYDNLKDKTDTTAVGA